MIDVYSAGICPFAQRVRALLTHLEIPFEVHEIDLSDRDPEFLELTPTGKVPLLVDGDFRLYESAIVNEYLADVHDWHAALPEEPRLRARARLAMKQWDETVLPPFYETLGEPALFEQHREAVTAELDEIERTVRALEPGASLPSLHCATHWVRMDWLREHTQIVAAVEERPVLHAWLEAAGRLPAIRRTLPDRDETVRAYEKRYVGATG